MNKRISFSIAVLVFISLAVAAFVMFDDSGKNKEHEDNYSSTSRAGGEPTGPDNGAKSVSASGEGSDVQNGQDKSESFYDSAAETDGCESIKTEDVKIIGNSPEYDLKAFLCLDSKGENYLSIEYYLDGSSTVKKLYGKDIPELNDIFAKREGAAGKRDCYRVKAIYLNAVYSKAYIVIEEEYFKEADAARTSVYAFNLKNASLKKLFSDIGRFIDMQFSKNYKYMGFSYYDNPASSVFQENSLLEIIKCETDESIVSGSRSKGEIIGGRSGNEYVYDYVFLAWNSGKVARLSETMWKKQGENEEKKKREVLYDVERNIFVNPDGSAAKEENAPAGSSGASENKSNESEAIGILKNFYSGMASQKDYAKAMGLLSSEFTLELNLLKQFGFNALTKDDIDLETASLYSELLKSARLESILKEETAEKSSKIYFYQSLSLDGETRFTLPMIAQLNKENGAWKILSAREGNANEPPFSAAGQ